VVNFISTASLDCQKNCKSVCSNIITIPYAKCSDMCQSHCALRTHHVYPKDSLSCLLKCDFYQVSKPQCNDLCLNETHHKHEAVDIPMRTLADSIEECIGYGTETCYSYCRLIEKMSIRVCKCACCAAKFCQI
jgi:hypothetical protein